MFMDKLTDNVQRMVVEVPLGSPDEAIASTSRGTQHTPQADSR